MADEFSPDQVVKFLLPDDPGNLDALGIRSHIVGPYDMRTNTKRIEIPGIIWEQELYDLIGAEFVRHFGAKK